MNILRLKELLQENKILGKELAEKIGVTENAISLIANGKRQPRFELLIKIADALDIDIKDLFTSTKDDNQTLYVLEDEEYKPIGSIKKL